MRALRTVTKIFSRCAISMMAVVADGGMAMAAPAVRSAASTRMTLLPGRDLRSLARIKPSADRNVKRDRGLGEIVDHDGHVDAPASSDCEIVAGIGEAAGHVRRGPAVQRLDAGGRER